jgi:large subunit ribosomal protein L16
MRLLPRSFKHKKQQKGKSFNKIDSLVKFQSIKFDCIKLVSCSHGRLSSQQFNSIRAYINKVIKKIGRVLFNVFPHTPITKKPIEVRMGKGKGNVDHWVFNCKVGFTLCEIQTKFKTKAILALKAAQIRLPIRTKIKF